MKSIKETELKGKVVLIRSDLNVPIKDGKITDENRIVQSLSTIKDVLAKEPKAVIICSHLGRIKEESDKAKKSLAPVATAIEKHLGEKVCFVSATRGAELEEAINNNKIVMFENTRWEDVVDGENVKNESKCNDELSKYWAGLCDVFVNDAFGTAHRAHASNVGITKYAKEAIAGNLLYKEIDALSKALNNPAHPYVAVMGGAKVSDKIEIINAMLKVADKIIIGGAMAYTFAQAQGFKTGTSLVEEDKIDLAKSLLEKANGKIVLPIDHICAEKFDGTETITCDDNITDGWMGLDVGPKSVELFEKTLQGAKTVIWNGPMGVFENDLFANGTKGVANAISKLDDAFTVIGGGDSAAAAFKFNIADKFSHVSTGGGASLEFLEGKELPAVKALNDK